jgi:hypothetical protein
MRRHSTDLVGLIFGTAFTIAGVAFLVNEVTDTNVNPAWVTGLGLMLLGAVALIATLVRGPRDREPDQVGEFPYAFAPGPEPTHLYNAPEGPTTETATTSED